MKNLKVLEILRRLEADGWYKVHCVGSHRQYKHPTKKGKVTVNGHERDEICGFLLSSIEKQSGLKF